jgi:hypothetical protein
MKAMNSKSMRAALMAVLMTVSSFYAGTAVGGNLPIPPPKPPTSPK